MPGLAGMASRAAMFEDVQMMESEFFPAVGKLVWRVVSPAILFAALTGTCLAQATNISEYPITSHSPSYPYAITPGPDGACWFTEHYAAAIGRIDTNGLITEIGLTNNPRAAVFGIVTLGSNLWFTEGNANRLACLTPTPNTNQIGYYVEYPLAGLTNNPAAIVVGPDGLLWFVEYSFNRIAAVDPNDPTNANGFVLFKHETGPLGQTNAANPVATNSQIYGLTVGPDGRIWFAEATWGVIGAFDTNLMSTNIYPLPVSNCTPTALATNIDGKIWFTEYNTNKIGSITTNGVIQEFTLPTNSYYPMPDPYGITAAADGSLWFTEVYGSAVGRITTNGVVTLFPTRTQPAYPGLLTTGSDGNIWFTEYPSAGSGSVDDTISVIRTQEALSLTAPATTSFSNSPGATYSNNLLATFLNSNPLNTVTVYWGDGAYSSLYITDLNASNNPSATVTNIVVHNSIPYTNTLTISNIVNLATNYSTNITTNVPAVTNITFIVTNGTFTVSASHTYAAVSNYPVTLTVTDSSNDMATAYIALTPAFFAGSVPLFAQDVNYLYFPGHNLFGYYSLQFYPYVYHFDMGFEYFIDAQDGQGGAYLYDFTSGHWWYTSPELFPYIYDFSLGAWLYYFPNVSTTDHYTTNPRQFYNLGTGTYLTQ